MPGLEEQRKYSGRTGPRAQCLVNLRLMLERAQRHRQDLVDGRWVIETRHRKQAWEIIVEPDSIIEVLVVVTAFPVRDL